MCNLCQATGREAENKIVAGFSCSDSGSSLDVSTSSNTLPVYTNDQIAYQLTDGFWGGFKVAHGVSTGGTITVNMTGLTAEGQYLAQAALELWSDATGLQFVLTSGSARITMDDAVANSAYNQFTSYYWNGAGYTVNATETNVGTGWLNYYGTSLNTYSMQTYVHEIGHALGLGHAGNYNGSAQYGVDNHYANDSWQTTVMSYFSQSENTTTNASIAYAVTPQAADIIAIQNLYGTTRTTRASDTTYGDGANSGDLMAQLSSMNTYISYTIIDDGGIDTLNYSSSAFAQTIDLRQEAYSSVRGYTENVTIARGTVIENAIGGSNNDILIGNAESNILIGNGGSDSFYMFAGNDTAFGGSGTDYANFSYAFSFYTFISFETYVWVIGEGVDSIFNDVEWLAFSDQSRSFSSIWDDSYQSLSLTGDASIVTRFTQYYIDTGSGYESVTLNGTDMGLYSLSGWSISRAETATTDGYWLFWTHTSGQQSIWRVNANGDYTTSYAPIIGDGGQSVRVGHAGQDYFEFGVPTVGGFRWAQGLGGDDVYVVSSNSGLVALASEAAGGGNDTIIFEDIAFKDIIIQAHPNAYFADSLIFSTSGGLQVHVHGADVQNNAIEAFQFADGTIINDFIFVDGAQPTTIGANGNDYIDMGTSTSGGFRWALGLDGDDIYVISQNSGFVALGNEAASGGTDKVVFSDLAFSQVTIQAHPDAYFADSLIFSAPSGLQVHVHGANFQDNAIEAFEFADGIIINNFMFAGGSAAATIGTASNDYFDLGASTTGGFRWALGLDGDDIYVISQNSGFVALGNEAAGGGSDKIFFKDLNRSDVTVQQHPDPYFADSLIFTASSGLQVHVHGANVQDNAIEAFQFADGQIINNFVFGASVGATPDTFGSLAASTALTGSALNDYISAGDGKDRLNGQQGDDYLIGGLDSDIFIFDALFGHDTIDDFSLVEDLIEISSSLFSGFSQLMASSSQSGSDVVIQYDQNNSITLLDTNLADIKTDDFLFV